MKLSDSLGNGKPDKGHIRDTSIICDSSYNRQIILSSVDQKPLDITDWLEYFTDGVLMSIQKVKEKVLQLSTEKQKRLKKGQIALTESQMRIIENIHRNERITSGEIQEMFKISRQAAHKELKKLINLDIIQQKGTGRATYYILK